MERVPGERRFTQKFESDEERRLYIAEVRERQNANVEDFMHNVQKQGRLAEEFKEVNEVRNLFASIVSIYKDEIAVENMIERALFILDSYQEQPHLLDPHLESLLSQLLDIIRDETTPPEVVHLAFKLMYMMTKTRGYKVILRLMPHEVADVEPVLALLSRQSVDSYGTWETRYMLLLWLSIVCMIPFDMSRLDSNMRTQAGEVRKPVMERIIDVGKLYLEVSDKSRDAAGYMLSRFMTRPDVVKTKLPEFLDWALKRLHTLDKQTVNGQRKIMGVLSTLALLFKHGKREDLVPYASTLLEQIISLKLNESINSNLRKFKIKIIQRIALTFLKSKVASWRYQRGSRSLLDNLKSGDEKTDSVVESKKVAQEDEEEYDIPDEMEEVIEQLLNGLRDPATIVRWSAAKGVGRVTGRLPQELADEVVGSIMDLFTFTETDAAWHGACLSLAELGRRGLLLPHRLPDVIPVILKSLAYDEKRGNFSVGSHVRDAACYVCWAFARAYEPQDIKPYVNQLATALLIVTVFDREINVRRAAAAAFQENVGRQGQFPHGIDIVVTCDYFAVGNQSNCFLELSVYLAQYEEYVHALIEHLYKVKVSHWDMEIRDLAAQALHKLTEKAPGFIIETVLPEIAENCTNIDLNHRHGSVMMSAYATLAIAQIAEKQNQNVSNMIGAKTTEVLKSVTQKLHDAKFFLGGGGEIMKKAVCCLIDKLSQAKMPFHNDPVIGAWQDLIDDCLLNVHQDQDVQKAAVAALTAFCTCYYQQANGSPLPEMQDKIISRYMKELQSSVETTRMGFALALGSLPKFMLKGRLTEVVSALVAASTISPKDVKFAESRRDALKALASLCTTVGVDLNGSPNDVLCSDNIPIIYDAFFKAMGDYTLDGRGDVGSWVREASMSGLQSLTSMLVTQHPKLITPERTERIFCCLVQQASEKIDRTREHAGEIFKCLLYHEPELPHVPHREELVKIFPLEELAKLNLAAPNVTFPLFTELLALPTFAYSVLLGLTVSVGGLTESLVRHSSASLMTYLRRNITDLVSCEVFCGLVQRVCADYPRTDRVMVPMMKMLDQLLASDCFSPLLEKEDPDFVLELLKTCKREVVRCGDPQKILACIDVCCGLLQFTGDVRKRTLQQLLIFLCHRYPIVRKNGAQKLYETVMMYDDIIDEAKLDEVMTILSQTEWDEPIEKIRPIRNQICDILDVPRPALKVAPKNGTPSTANGDAAK